MICLNCNHMENMDYIHGTGTCAIMEGETVVLDQECICPAETLKNAETFLRKNGKDFACNPDS